MLKIERYYSDETTSVYDSVKWEFRSSILYDEKGNILKEIHGIEVPVGMGQIAVDILAQKYFRNMPGINETSYRSVVHRLAYTWKQWGIREGYFDNVNGAIFYDEIAYMLLHRLAAPNSPQFFNTGIYEVYGYKGDAKGHWYTNKDNEQVESESEFERIQAQACFLLQLDDHLFGEHGIYDALETEARIFRSGSGSGVNCSSVRGREEPLKNGGTSSGLISFLKIFDSSAGAIKSGGSVRRAATMRILDIDHPDIVEFIEWKAKEEKKAHTLINGGYDSHYEGEAYTTISGQNSNNSIRIGNDFMEHLEAKKDWNTRSRYNGQVVKTYKSEDLWEKIAESAWNSAEPGIQFDTTINEWHKIPNYGYSSTTNPCLPESVDVFTKNDGIRQLKDIKVNDLIWSKDGWTKVKKKWKTGRKEVWIFETENGNLFCTEDHKIVCKGEKVAAKDATHIDSFSKDPYKVTNKTKAVEILNKRVYSEEDVWDIEVDNVSHTFWCNGFNISNCSEITNVPNASCNLASLNLTKWLTNDGRIFDYEGFSHAIRLWTLVLDISITMAHYPNKAIAKTANDIRLLGLGYSNLGSLFMRRGIAYCSKEAEDLTGIFSSLLTSIAYKTSIELSMIFGSFPAYKNNTKEMMNCIENYAIAGGALSEDYKGLSILPNKLEPQKTDWINRGFEMQRDMWKSVISNGEMYGFRNAEVTAIAPCGTIGLLMDCDTTGIEPEFSLIKHKKLSGGGYMKIVNRAVTDSLKHLGYSIEDIREIEDEINNSGNIYNSKKLKESDKLIFRCASGENALNPIDHVHILASAQRFITQSISKTINMQNDASINDIKDIYLKAWELGIKCVSLYRDGCKMSQPLNIKSEKKEKEAEVIDVSKEYCSLNGLDCKTCGEGALLD